MNLLSTIAILATLIYAPGDNYWNKTWIYPWAQLLFGAAILFCYRIRPIPLALALCYALINGVANFAVAGQTFNISSISNSAYSLIAIAGILIFCVKVPVKTARVAIALSSLLTMFGVITLWAMGKRPEFFGAFIGNNSMTGCFIAASLPLCLTEAYDVFDHVINSTIVGLSFIAICILGQSLPFITLFVTTLAFIAHKLKGRWPYYILGSTALLCAVIYLVPGFHQGEFFNDSNRFMIWKMGIDHYLDGPITQQIFGLGLGTTQNLLFTWQGNSNDHWIWYHNDALQTLIEIGVVGFALCIDRKSVV